MRHPKLAKALAEEAGLVYVSDVEPGLRRIPRGRGFVYFDARDRRVTEPRVLARIRALAIPPAWTEVWISSGAYGHIQATGRDARGRKQYRYHARWREHRDEAKYQRLYEFGLALPRMRRRIAADLRKPGIPREKVLAALVRLLETTLIRVGNDEYARANHSYGLTTLRERHVHFAGAKIIFHFRGKAGVERVLELRDPRLARVMRRCQDLPGQDLFQYVDREGGLHRVSSGDVNEYLREISGTEFTAKYFRTWGGTLAVMCRLAAAGPPESAREAKRVELEAIRDAARILGNTAAVCRSFYVHPAVLEAYRKGTLARLSGRRERMLMRLLRAAATAR